MTDTKAFGSKAFNLFSWVAAGAGITAVVIAVLLQIAGLHLVIVQTGSMNPAIPAGSVVLTRSMNIAQAKAGDVLTIRQPNGGYVTHRLVSARPAPGGQGEVVTTKGDANLTNDPLPLTVVNVNKVKFIIPSAGKVLDMMSSKYAAALFGALVIAGLVVFWRDMNVVHRHTSSDPRQDSLVDAPQISQPQPRPRQAVQPVAPSRPVAPQPPTAAPAQTVSPRTAHQQPVQSRRARPVEVSAETRFGRTNATTVARIVALSLANPEANANELAAKLMGISVDRFVNPELVREVVEAIKTPPLRQAVTNQVQVAQ